MERLVSEMTRYVSTVTLNLTHALTCYEISMWHLEQAVVVHTQISDCRLHFD